MWDWVRRFCLAGLVCAWVLAVGVHDLALSEHGHDECSSEIVLAQVWHWDAGMAPPTVSAAVAVLVLLIVIQRLQQMSQGVRPLPERYHSPPRPPDIEQLFFRGPPYLTSLRAKSRNGMESHAAKLHSFWLVGIPQRS